MGAEQAWVLAAIPAGVFLVLALFGRALPRGGDYLGIAAIALAAILLPNLRKKKDEALAG